MKDVLPAFKKDATIMLSREEFVSGIVLRGKLTSWVCVRHVGQ
jgi:hypothetical protein